SYLFYRKKDLPLPLKSVLITLRFLSVFLILLLLANPVIAFINSSSISPKHIYLTDVSGSLIINNRIDTLKMLVKDLENNSSKDDFYFFSERLIKRGNENNFFSETGYDNTKTNLTNTLSEIFSDPGNKISSVTLISDGMINSGGIPLETVRSSGIP
ncbi:hypothetical protein ABQG68_19605, partial [Bacillus pumilus]|uniref:hypothetical protein n=1 Tax=Bacillus pumilus TaxID=1408 RepID=UPI0033157924